ncbi:MAG: right-handed parallel beta-helix repeat-containing protein, partial [Candidatus Hodarchaeota archaeon]
MVKNQSKTLYRTLLFVMILLIPMTAIYFEHEIKTVGAKNKPIEYIEVPLLRSLNLSNRYNYNTSETNLTTDLTTVGENNEINKDQFLNNPQRHKIIISSPADDPVTVQSPSGSEVSINRISQNLNTSANDIVVNEITSWQNQNIIVNHTIIVNSSILSLINTTITFNCTNSFWGIKVIGNGELHLVNSTIKSINEPSIIIANSTSLVNSTWSEIELFRGENYSTYYGTNTNTTAILSRGNSIIELNRSKVSYLKGLDNVTFHQEYTSIFQVKLLDFSTIVSNSSFINFVDLFEVSTFNSSFDQITQMSKTSTILNNDTVTDENLTLYITQNVNISDSTVMDTRNNIFLGQNQNVSLINLSTVTQNIDWVYGDKASAVKTINSTLPLKGIIKSHLDSIDSNFTVNSNSILGHLNLYNSNCLIENVTVLLNGNTIIHQGGNLTLINTQFIINSSYNGEFHIAVLEGGEINILSNSVISSGEILYRYAFWSMSGSIFRMMNSLLEYCGYSVVINLAGLYVNRSKKFVFENNTIKSEYYGLVLEGVSDQNVVGNTIIGGKTGILINNSNTINIQSNIIQDLQESLSNMSSAMIFNHCYNCTVSNNIMNNITGGMNGKGPSQSDGDPGGSGVGIYLSNSFNNSLKDNVLSNISGGLAGTGGTQGNGGTGGFGVGFYLFNSSNNKFFWNSITNVTGGTGGDGGNNGDGGMGGLGSGYYIANSSFNTFTNSKIDNITGGTGGFGGINGVDGAGGSVAGFYVVNSSENVITFTVSNLTVGEGNPTGIIEFIHLEVGFNNSWAYQMQQQTNYDQNYSIYFGLHNYPTNDTILLYYHADIEVWEYEEVTNQQNYTFSSSLLSFGTWEWFIWFNDTANVSRETPILNFSVIDTSPPTFSDLSQTSSTPEYYENNTVSINVSEPVDASGIDTILIFYRVDTGLWISKDVTSTSNHTFYYDILVYDQNYEWYFWFNDTAGNINQSSIWSFDVVDLIDPIYSDLSQTNPTPEYDETNTVSITVSEPINASGVDSIWLYYRIDSGVWIQINVTETSNYTFTANMLKYDQTYDWYFWFNDTAGNSDQTSTSSFSVIDTNAPTYSDLSQSNPTPEYDETNTVSVTVSEPINASGVDSIWLYYQIDGGSWIQINVTETNNFTFVTNILKYNQIYDWYFWFNDTAGNSDQTPTSSFTVIDTNAPTYSGPSQSNPTPNYNETNTVSVVVSEPVNASGIDSIWLFYRIDSGSWIQINVIETSNYTFIANMLKYDQIYDWYFWFNDTAGNSDQTSTSSFTVIDTNAPTYSDLSQSNPTPEYDETNTVSVTVSEPVNASGVGSIWLYYRIDGGSWIQINVTETSSYTFTDNTLKYDQTYDWYFWFNDTAGNSNQTTISTFTVIDITAPTYSGLSQSSLTPEYDESNNVSVTVNEPINASGIDSIWLYYQLDAGPLIKINVTEMGSYTFTPNMLKYGQTYEWYFWFNDTAGNSNQTTMSTFIIIDITAPTYSGLSQSNPTPEYDITNTVSVTLSEPVNASGVDSIWLYYRIDGGSWIQINVTETSSYTFVANMLKYDQTYDWYFWFNDTAGNSDQTPLNSFVVIDTTAPIYSGPIQSNSNPEYDEVNDVSIVVSEPENASGVDSIWFYYRIDSGPWVQINVTETSSYTFTTNMLKYNQTFEWYFWFNDTAGNNNQTPSDTFTVIDITTPTYSGPSQSNPTPEYDEMNIVSVSVSEPINASGVDSIWLYYRIDGGLWIQINVTETSSFTFTANMLKYDQTYDWYFWFNDTAGNNNQTSSDTFTVTDITAPTYSGPTQSNPTPEYDETNTVSVSVNEPINASGVNSISLYYRIDGGSWIQINVTETSSYTFTINMLKYDQTYDWYFWFNDTAGNSNQTLIDTFTVVDTAAPTYSGLSQSNSAPEYNEENTISITVSEPSNASGVDSIFLYYRIDGGIWIQVNVTQTSSYTFTANMLRYDQTYNWYFWFNDTAGNSNQTLIDTFIVVDTAAPTYSGLSQSNSAPEYDEENTVSITVSEPTNASGVDLILLYYRIDGGTWIQINVTEISGYTFVANMLKYDQMYDWYFWFNDTAGNSDQTPLNTFTVIDITAPTYSGLSQSTPSPEYDEMNSVSVTINEPANASGIDSIWFHYQLDGGLLIKINVTETSSYIFTANMLKYGQTYEWYFWFNDTAGNNNQTLSDSFTVTDITAPTYSGPNQTNSTPEYNETNSVSVTVYEPVNASGIDSIWLYYQIDGGSLIKINVTETSSYIFTANMLKYGQIYEWYFWFNDTAGNSNQTTINTFTVIDTIAPTYSGFSQSNPTPEYDETNSVSVTVSEPINASGVDSVILYYRIDGGVWMTINVTETSSYIFSANTLKYDQTYDWYFWFNDTAGNSDQTTMSTFTVIDTTVPTYSGLSQTNPTPEYDETNTVSVSVDEPINASGIDSIWLFYRIDSGTWIQINVTETSSYTFTSNMLKFNQAYDWYFWFNDTAGNSNQTISSTFTIIDITAPTYTDLNQSNPTSEYNETNTVSVTVNEPVNASGIDSIWLYYRIDDGSWIQINVTETSSYTFTANMLKYDQIYNWYFWFNDTAGNTNQTTINSFTVIDTIAPTYLGLSQSNPTPEYDETNTVSVTVSEPINASGVYSIWLHYRIDGGSLIRIDVTETSSYTFTTNMLKYGQTYEWYFWFNDTAGNIGQTSLDTFTVIDTTAPTYSGLSQSNSTPEYDESNIVSVMVSEPINTSGVDSIWLFYRIDSGGWIQINVTETSSYSFTANMLKYDQTYEWYFWFNDTAGNNNQTPSDTFTVIDITAPTYSGPTQSNPTLEYDETNAVSISVNEPINASGINIIWFYYRIDGGAWIQINVTETSSYAFTANMLKYDQIYEWYFWFNDTAGNSNQTLINIFTVIDTTAPTYSDIDQTSSTPEYDETNTVSVLVSEPVNASGIDSIWLYYQIDGGSLIQINVTETSSYTFTANMFKYGQTYEWYFWFNDTAGNSNQTLLDTFIVIDTT